MGLIQSVVPELWPVTTAQVRDHVRIDSVTEDPLLDSYIGAATGYVEGRTDRQLMNATWVWTLEGFMSPMYVPHAPLSSVTSIAYLDTAGNTQTLSASVYDVDTATEPGRILLANNQNWPAILGGLASVTITFVAGYGDETSDVPERLRMAIMQLIAQWYDIREPMVMGAINDVPRSVEALINQLKLPDMAAV